jgi:mannosyltransferase OCH1-like enzyme
MISNNYFCNNDILIKNNYYVIENPHNDEFHIAIYYISKNKCKIIIRRLDSAEWGQDLKIKIIDIDNINFEKISLGSCNENLKVVDIYTNIILHKTEYNEQLIQQVIIQTSNESMNKNIFHYNSIISFVELNPEYEYKFFTDDECREFIFNNFKDIIDVYDLLIPGKIKADLFKYAYLYTNGGCYFNCKTILFKSLNKIINPEDKIILYSDNGVLKDGIILIEKNNIILLDILNKLVSNISENNTENNTKNNTKNKLVNITSNIIFNIYFKDTEYVSLIKENNYIYAKNDINKNRNTALLKYHYNNYQSNANILSLWNNNEIYYQEYKTILSYKFYFYPSNCNDKFDINFLKDNLFEIKRTDNDCGWGQHIKLKVINIINGKTYYLDIGNSDNNIKPFILSK